MKEDATPIDPTWMNKTGGFARDMTLRDHYAGLAMQAMLSRRESITCPDEILAQDAYNTADAMLDVRERK